MIKRSLTLCPPGSTLSGAGGVRIGGCDVRELAEEFGTPALLVAPAALRENAAAYLRAFTARHPRTTIYFATKAFHSSAVIREVTREGLGCEVTSAGELAFALGAGVPPERMLLHGNARTTADFSAALAAGVGRIVLDSLDDIHRLRPLLERPQRVLLRINPGVESGTHASMATGHADSKFGVPLEQAPPIIDLLRRDPLLELEGIHAHVGSQIVDLGEFERCIAALAGLGRFGVYDFGGGLGMRYAPDEPVPSVDEYAERVVSSAHARLGRDIEIVVEPGRSLVANAAVTLYRVVTVKRGARTHVAVDGGMGDNLEPMLCDTRFVPAVVGKAGRPAETCDVVGRHCESGDVLVRDTELESPSVDDLLLVPMTGAYCYALMNNYNGACRPPVIFCEDGRAQVVVRRETIDDLTAREAPALTSAT